MLVLDFALNQVVNGTMTDTRGSGFVGVCTDTIVTSDEGCPFERCMSFNGRTSKIFVADITCPADFTIATWVKRSNNLSFFFSAIVAFADDLPFFGFRGITPVLANTLTSTQTIDTSWSHLAAIQDSTGCRIYLNGQIIGFAPSRARTGGRGMVIGCNLARRNAWFEGQIASVMIFDEALPETELLQLMRSPRSLVLTPRLGPIIDPQSPQRADVDVVVPVVEEPKPPPENIAPRSETILAAPIVAIEVDFGTENAALDIAETMEVETIEVETIEVETIEVARDTWPIAPNWRFERTFEIEGVKHQCLVFVVSISMIEGSSPSEYEVTFSLEFLGKQLLIPIRHPTRICSIEDCTTIFEKHAVEVFLKVARTAHQSLDWFRKHVDFGA